ncbi:MAG: DUF4390 domain-containing protein [bacterium]
MIRRNRLPPRRLAAALAIALLVVAVHAATPFGRRAGAAEPRPPIDALSVDRGRDGSLRLRFHAEALFDREARDAIESGVTAIVSVSWAVERARGLWFDETLARGQEFRRVAYDNVTQRYRVDFEGDDAQHFETSSFDEAEREVGTVDTPLRADLSAPGDKLVRVRLSCDSRDGMLPLGLEKVLFFLPGWGFDTGWVDLKLP